MLAPEDLDDPVEVVVGLGQGRALRGDVAVVEAVEGDAQLLEELEGDRGLLLGQLDRSRRRGARGGRSVPAPNTSLPFQANVCQ